MAFIKQHWKEILFVLLVIFSLNKCTVACNRDTKINNQQEELIKKDSIIKVQADSLNILNIRWNDSQNSKSDLKDIALGNKEELSNQINQLTNQNNELNNRINSLINENNKLKQENSKLTKQIKQLNEVH